VTLLAKVSEEMQQPGDDIAVHEDSGGSQGGVRKDVEETGGDEKRQVLKVVQVNPADPIHLVVRTDLCWARIRIQRRLS
jgi:hypothetical protein